MGRVRPLLRRYDHGVSADSADSFDKARQLGPAVAPLVVAHRGASAHAAEHTLLAYQYALDDGADAFECDVRLTRDGHLVCIHDRRLDRTSDGRGVVSQLDLADLHQLDFSSWKYEFPDNADHLIRDRPHEIDPDADAAARRVLTFKRLLEFVVSAQRPVRLLVETKHPTKHGRLVELRMVEMLRRFGLADPPDPDAPVVSMMSFSALAVRRVRDLAPRLPTVLLLVRLPGFLRSGALPFGVRIAGPGIRLLRAFPDYVERAHAAGNKVYVWTVDEPGDVDLALSLGVDAIITNRPAQVRARIHNEPQA